MVVPSSGRDFMLAELQVGHPAAKSASKACGLVAWFGLYGRGCGEELFGVSARTNITNISTNATKELANQTLVSAPFDFVGPLEGRMILIVVDAHSKWSDVIPMKSATALTTVQTLQTLFSRFGVPESIVSDNGPQFVAVEFQEFCKRNRIRHILIAPYHTASNGLAERCVQTFKRGLKKFSEGIAEDQMARFVLQYITPHTTTGRCPSELLFRRKLRT